ncbi:MAG: 2-C-methyl-D-erythritol 4-phosphate cytidylyltransferase [Chitinivibrionia bacterium]|nr:2-C-methyl-D-erythritol 4-phosphate cytidylyltransferase [Chitinivibrionia bacterium]
MNVSAVIVAGGMGKRLEKEIPKAFVPILGKELFLYGAQIFDKMRIFNEIVIAVAQSVIEETIRKTSDFSTKIIVVEGGKERHNSVENAIKATSADAVLIHDAARPFVTSKLVGELLKYYEEQNVHGVISANPVVDTIRKFDGNMCKETVNREELIAVATPQIFDKKILSVCFEKIGELDKIPTDEAMLVQHFGYKVAWLKGDKLNFKITTPQDLILAEAILKMGVLE